MLGCDLTGLVDAQKDIRSLILPQGVKKKLLKNLLVPTVLFYYFAITPLEKCVTFHLNMIESLLPKSDLCLVWLKLDLE